uniref:Probable proline--tRNA ligase, mitochondrial n=1 Tax=Xenopsylla cheopis TaxID=163159 RepID=A0A6M2DI79_XENCH
MNRLSKIFQPLLIIPKNAQISPNKDVLISKSQKLLTDVGIIRSGAPGSYHLLPLGERVLTKLCNLIDKYMQRIEAQKIYMPSITSADLWKATGRLDNSELFTLQDRHERTYVLGPTHEESITALIASLAPLSYKMFPIKLYQISSKYRDEIKPRFGLLRAREFIMKDLYTFDINKEEALKSYELVNEAYFDLFTELNVPFVKVEADGGTIGGTLSHEYHILADVGEDRLLNCNDCGFLSKSESIDDIKDCPECKTKNVLNRKGIEVGHSFYLEDRYTKPLDANFLSVSGKPQVLQMGCHGLGVSRIIAATLEALSSAKELRWPLKIAPYIVCIVTPKKGSKEEDKCAVLADSLYKDLTVMDSLKNDVVVDDRTAMTIGKRLREAKRTGYPFIIVVGEAANTDHPLYELHDTINETETKVSKEGVIDFLKQRLDWTIQKM